MRMCDEIIGVSA